MPGHDSAVVTGGSCLSLSSFRRAEICETCGLGGCSRGGAEVAESDWGQTFCHLAKTEALAPGALLQKLWPRPRTSAGWPSHPDHGGQTFCHFSKTEALTPARSSAGCLVLRAQRRVDSRPGCLRRGRPRTKQPEPLAGPSA